MTKTTLAARLPEDAIDTAGVAEILEVSAESVRRYLYSARTTPKGDATDLPLPAAHLGRSPIWSAAVIEAWAAGRPGHGHGTGGRYKNTPAPSAATD